MAADSQKIRCQDHLGNWFESQADMARTYGISVQTLNVRLSRCWNLKEALTTPVRKTSKKCHDHLGNEYNSIKEMCTVYRVNPDLYTSRRKRGYSIEESLNSNNTGFFDHLGNRYKSIREMLAKYGLEYQVYNDRKQAGWDLERILTTPIKQINKAIDHKGNCYDNIEDMVSAYGVSRTTFNRRIKSGWSLEEALETSVNPFHRYKGLKVFGFDCKYISDITNNLNITDISKATLQYRLGLDKIELEVISVVPNLQKHYRIEPEFIGINHKAYYIVDWNNKPVTTRQVIEHYRPDLLEAYDRDNPTGEYRPYKRG